MPRMGTVPDLLMFSRPSDIPWFVVSVVVNPVQAPSFSRWARRNVLKEISEIHPAITHLYSSTSVPVPFIKTWAQTAVLHRVPCPVNPRPRVAVLVASPAFRFLHRHIAAIWAKCRGRAFAFPVPILPPFRPSATADLFFFFMIHLSCNMRKRLRIVNTLK